MIISIIGSGNTATVLGNLLKEKHHIIQEVIGRNKISVNKLAKELNTNACTEINQIDRSSDVYIIAVKDEAVAEISAQLILHEKIVVHTGGSISINVLERSSKNHGVLYPLQSLRKELHYTPVVPFLIDGNNAFTKENILHLASSVSDTVIIADDETRLRYHLSAIIVSNFTNHLFTLAKDYCKANNTNFNLLLPLIEEIVSRLHHYEPSALQTGPAIRGDEIVIQKHIALLNDFPELKEVYEVMSKSIKDRHKL